MRKQVKILICFLKKSGKGCVRSPKMFETVAVMLRI